MREGFSIAWQGDHDSRFRLREEIRARIARIDLYGDPESCPEANESVALGLEVMRQAGFGVVVPPLNWPRYKITFSNGFEQWVFCRHKKLKYTETVTERDLSKELFFLIPAAPMIKLLDKEKTETKNETGKRKGEDRTVITPGA